MVKYKLNLSSRNLFKKKRVFHVSEFRNFLGAQQGYEVVSKCNKIIISRHCYLASKWYICDDLFELSTFIL